MTVVYVLMELTFTERKLRSLFLLFLNVKLSWVIFSLIPFQRNWPTFCCGSRLLYFFTSPLHRVDKVFLWQWDRAVFNRVSKVIGELLWFALLRSVIGSKIPRHFFDQSEVKPKPIVTRVPTFSRALCRVITSSFDWITGLWLAKVISLVLAFRHLIETHSKG